MADPLLDGSVQVSVTVPLLLVLAETPVGAPGDVAGVTELEAPDWRTGTHPVDGGHRERVERTVGQQGRRLGGGRREEGLGRLGRGAVEVRRDGVPDDVEPLVTPGAVQVSEADALPRVAVPMVGAPGTFGATTELEADEGSRYPRMVAVTVNE